MAKDNVVDGKLSLAGEAGLTGCLPGGLEDGGEDVFEGGLGGFAGVVLDEAAGAGGLKEERGGEIGGGLDCA